MYFLAEALVMQTCGYQQLKFLVPDLFTNLMGGQNWFLHTKSNGFYPPFLLLGFTISSNC